jgi:uncharacterized protein (TIGR03790 family)
MIKVHILILAAVLLAQAETLSGTIQPWNPTGGKISGYAVDADSIGTTITVKFCVDGITSNCTTTISANDANGTNNVASSCPLSPGTYGNHCFNQTLGSTLGGVSIKDGTTHTVWAYAVSPTAQPDHLLFVPVPIKWDATNSRWLDRYTPVRESTPARLTKTHLAPLVNSNDTYSIGTTGNACPGGIAGGSGTIGTNGVAGAYIAAHGSDLCDRTYIVACTKAASITKTAADSCLLPTLTAMDSNTNTIDAVAVMWNQPATVTNGAGVPGNGITSYVALKGWTNATNTQVITGTPLAGDAFASAPNPCFNTGTKTPFATCGIRYAMMVAGQSISAGSGDPATTTWVDSVANATTMINKAIAGVDTNPTGTARIIRTTDTGRQTRANAYAGVLSLSGITITTDISASAAGNYNFSDASLVYYATGVSTGNSANSWSLCNGCTFLGPADSLTSSNGQLPSNTSQTPMTEFLRQGATATYGCVAEPGAQLRMFPDPAIFLANVRDGLTLLEAYWKSTEINYNCNFAGDPLASLYSLPIASTPLALSGKLKMSGKVTVH